jgi:hypothetical protein
MKNKSTVVNCLILALGLAASGCVNFDGFDASREAMRSEVKITGNISQVPTRASASGFGDKDAVGIYVVNYVSDTTRGTMQNEGNQADHVKYVFDSDNNVWNSLGKVYYKDQLTLVDIYGYYPYSRPDTVGSYKFELKQDQTTARIGEVPGGYEASDFLWGVTTGVKPTTSAVSINFSHKMSCALVTLAEGTGFSEGEFAALEKNVLVTGTTRKSSIDLSTGVVTPLGSASQTGTVMMNTTDGFRAIVVPQTVAAQTSLFSITLDGIVYQFKKDEAFTYAPGKMSRFTITINKKGVSGTYELQAGTVSITDWTEDTDSHGGDARQYFVVNVTTPGTLGATLKSLNKDGTKIKNLKVTGTIDARDFFYMRDTMSVLQALNLKEVAIAQYASGSSQYPANEIPDYAIDNKKSLFYLVLPDNITKIGGFAFRSTSITGALIIPEGVTDIEQEAFYHCGNISSVAFPSTLRKIGYGSFGYCTSLSGNLSLPYGLQVIDSGAFSDCSNLTGSLILPGSLEYIGGWAFGRCSSFTGSLTIPDNVKSLDTQCFDYCIGFTGQLILHDNLSLEGSFIFRGCRFQGELVLPKDLSAIPSYTFEGCQFSSIANWPEGLVSIGKDAFWRCQRLSTIPEFPENLSIIGENAFSECSQLAKVVLPEHLSLINSSAFYLCTALSSIICKAVDPPNTASNAFDGVAKDNFTVEVPETSVNRYQAATGWSDFKRISVFRDFSINRNKISMLNAGGSRILMLRALSGAGWSVTSCPSWVTVSPSSGTGKTEVTFNVGALASGSANRTDTVVFTLSGTDYTQKTVVSQYNYTYGDGDYATLQTATKGSGVNVVIMGDCFDAADISVGTYLTDMNTAYGHLFTVEPYKTYKDYFNVYCVFGMSGDSGIGTVNNIRDAKFGCQYNATHGISPDKNICFEYACKAPINNDVSKTLIVLIPNTTEYGGITYMWGDGSAIAVCPMSSDAYPYDFRGIVQHEADGHGFGKLGDEYIYVNNFVDRCHCGYPHVEPLKNGKALGWYRNLSLSSDPHSVDWAHLIFNPKYANVVDIYEGGWFHTRGVFRSEPNSCMNNNIPYFSAISRQAIVERIMSLAGLEFNIDDFYANDVLTINGTKGTVNAADLGLDSKPSYKQFPPQYMGEKPDFKPSNK